MKSKIIKILTFEKDPSIRFEVLEKFYSYVEDDNDINLIINILDDDPDPCVRHEAAAQLFRIELKKNDLLQNLKSKAIEILFRKATTDPSIVVQHESIEALAYLVGPEHLEQLRVFIDSNDLDIQSTATIAFHTAKKRIESKTPARDLSSLLIQEWIAPQTI